MSILTADVLAAAEANYEQYVHYVGNWVVYIDPNHNKKRDWELFIYSEIHTEAPFSLGKVKTLEQGLSEVEKYFQRGDFVKVGNASIRVSKVGKTWYSEFIYGEECGFQSFKSEEKARSWANLQASIANSFEPEQTDLEPELIGCSNNCVAA